MSVNMLLGAPGSGKSYEAVAFHVIPELKAGRKVITNLPLIVDEIGKFDSSIDLSLLHIIEPTKDIPRPFSSIKHFSDSWRHPITGSGPFYVIDECHFCFPRGSTSKDIQEWFSMHRHESADVLLITQSHSKVEKNITDLLQIVYRVRKNTALGFSKSYVRKVQDGLRGEVVNTSVRSYDAKYFPLYKSYTMNGGKELAPKDVRPIWRSPIFVVFFLLLISFILILVFYGNPIKKLMNPSSDKTIVKKEDSKKKDDSIDQNGQLNASVSSKTDSVSSISKPSNVSAIVSSIANDDFYNPPHPYFGFNFVMKGCLSDKKTGKHCFFNIVKNGENASTVTEQDLRDAGYSITFVSRCLSVIRYDNRNYMAVCSPDSVSTYSVDPTANSQSEMPKPLVSPSSLPYDSTPKDLSQAQQQKKGGPV